MNLAFQYRVFLPPPPFLFILGGDSHSCPTSSSVSKSQLGHTLQEFWQTFWKAHSDQILRGENSPLKKNSCLLCQLRKRLVNRTRRIKKKKGMSCENIVIVGPLWQSWVLVSPELPFYNSSFFTGWLHMIAIFILSVTNGKVLLVCSELLFQVRLLFCCHSTPPTPPPCSTTSVLFWSVLSHWLSWHTNWNLTHVYKHFLFPTGAFRDYQTPEAEQ